MKESQGILMIVLGAVLVVLGLVAPMLMVLKITPTNYVVCFLSYGASVGGFLLGLAGVGWYSEARLMPLKKS